MKSNTSKPPSLSTSLPKCRTGIQGLDEITGGGFPRGRPTLICGGAGCGKTLLAAEFLVRGAVQFDEPGVPMAFEETEAELTANVASLGFDLGGLVRRKKLVIDCVHLEPGEFQESGDYDLAGLFVRLNYAIDAVGAKRVVLDTLEALFSGLRNEVILRAELRRLFRWLKVKGVTAIITAERGRDQLTRHGLEEYVSDCVILLDHRVNDRIATRHLRVVKYRGAQHGTNEFPFLIGDDGISVLPITSLALNHRVSNERIATGIPRLDAMPGGKGFFRGSSILLTATSGTGKTIISANLAHAACQRGERTLFFSFEESPNQICRNMHSIGLRLEPLVKRGLLRFQSARPSLYGLEMHLATMFREIAAFAPQVVVIDPVTSLLDSGTASAFESSSRVPDFRPRYRPCGCVYWHQRRADRFRPGGAGGAGAGRAPDGAAAGGPVETRSGAQAYGARASHRRVALGPPIGGGGIAPHGRTGRNQRPHDQHRARSIAAVAPGRQQSRRPPAG